jgi:hypothetical protein
MPEGTNAGEFGDKRDLWLKLAGALGRLKPRAPNALWGDPRRSKGELRRSSLALT